MTDFMTPAQRSRAMSRVKNKDTNLEHQMCLELDRLNISYVTQYRELPGKPDIVFADRKLAVFVDGDFWHGYRFPAWKSKVPSFWQKKIADTRQRDQRNFRKLRRMGWRVIRIWQHEIKKDKAGSANKILAALQCDAKTECG